MLFKVEDCNYCNFTKQSVRLANRLKQILINNGFLNEVFDRCVKKFLNNHFNNSNDEKEKIKKTRITYIIKIK